MFNSISAKCLILSTHLEHILRNVFVKSAKTKVTGQNAVYLSSWCVVTSSESTSGCQTSEKCSKSPGTWRHCGRKDHEEYRALRQSHWVWNIAWNAGVPTIQGRFTSPINLRQRAVVTVKYSRTSTNPADFLIIRTCLSGPRFSWILISHILWFAAKLFLQLTVTFSTKILLSSLGAAVNSNESGKR